MVPAKVLFCVLRDRGAHSIWSLHVTTAVMTTVVTLANGNNWWFNVTYKYNTRQKQYLHNKPLRAHRDGYGDGNTVPVLRHRAELLHDALYVRLRLRVGDILRAQVADAGERCTLLIHVWYWK